mmetsp:Transcript_37713/g.106567  ORF Transcript_37713/g.106567 Transcript_37713/m.106567 type:complete len:312 (-) Transcript_37713:615-1550(-)
MSSYKQRSRASSLQPETTDDEGTDWQDSSSSEEPSPKPRPRPGTITPLGIRHDKSKGPLGLQTAASTIQEMDTAIARLRSWQSSRHSQMAALRREEQRDLHALEFRQQGSEMQDTETSAGHSSPGDRSSNSLDAAMCRVVREDRELVEHRLDPHAVPPWKDAGARPRTASPNIGRLGVPSSRDAWEGIYDRPSTSYSIVRGPGAPLTRPLVPDELRLLRESMTLTFPAERGPCPAPELPLSSNTPQGSRDERTDSARGDQLLAELEAELEEMDRELEENELVAWEGDLQEVLSKMDALQTGYQALAHGKAT